MQHPFRLSCTSALTVLAAVALTAASPASTAQTHTYTGYMCKPYEPARDLDRTRYFTDGSIVNSDSRDPLRVYCPVTRSLTGDIDATLYVIDRSSTTNFFCFFLGRDTRGIQVINQTGRSVSTFTKPLPMNFSVDVNTVTPVATFFHCDIPPGSQITMYTVTEF